MHCLGALLLAGRGPSEALNPTLQHSGSVQLGAYVTVFGVACQPTLFATYAGRPYKVTT